MIGWCRDRRRPRSPLTVTKRSGRHAYSLKPLEARVGGVGIHVFLPGVSVRSWLNPFRVSDGVWLCIPAPPTLFCCARKITAKDTGVQQFSLGHLRGDRRFAFA